MTSDVRAAGKDDVLTAIGRLGSSVRKSLGDTKTTRTPAANEMLSASSLDAVAQYMAGQELTRQTRDEEAIPYFKRATELDPNFGRAYSAWGTAAFKIGRQDEAEANHKKALSLLDRMTERERYRTLGVYYLAVSKNYDKAIENFSDLVKSYPSDAAAYNNLAVAYTNKLDFPNASENGRKALEIYPKNRLYRSNYALYAMYAGDFKASATEAANLLKEDPNYFIAYLPLAIAALSRGEADAAADFYTQMAKVNARAASLASTGLADLALFEGRDKDALDLLAAGIRADEETKTLAGAAVKRLAVAEAYEMEGDLKAAVPAASTAVSALERRIGSGPREPHLCRGQAAARDRCDCENSVESVRAAEARLWSHRRRVGLPEPRALRRRGGFAEGGDQVCRRLARPLLSRCRLRDGGPPRRSDLGARDLLQTPRRSDGALHRRGSHVSVSGAPPVLAGARAGRAGPERTGQGQLRSVPRAEKGKTYQGPAGLGRAETPGTPHDALTPIANRTTTAPNARRDVVCQQRVAAAITLRSDRAR